MKEPLISIIIPVFNAEKNIAETIDSALAQSWSNKEIIVVDDGSSDNSLEILSRYNDTLIKIFEQKNRGSSVARNKGLLEAKGDYIQFLDADDLLSPNKVESQLNLLLQHPDKIAVCSTIHFFNDENYNEGASSAYEDSFLYDTDSPIEFLLNLYGCNGKGSMIQTNAWLTPASLIRKAGNWSEFYSPDDDGEFFCRVLLAGKGVVYAKNCFNYYRKYKTGNNLASGKTKQALHGKFKSFLLKKQYLLNAADNLITKRALTHSAMEIAIDAYLVDKNLCAEILQTIGELGGTTYVPTLGGRYIELVKNIFGWKAALKLRHIRSKISLK